MYALVELIKKTNELRAPAARSHTENRMSQCSPIENTRKIGRFGFKALAMGFFVVSQLGLVSAKDLPGASKTSYSVNNSGAFNFTVPIVVPAGTNGVQPNLSLNYSSSRGNGMLGVGWGLGGLSAITRCSKTFASNGKAIGVQHNNNDRFCLNGQQLKLVSGSYGADGSEYRTEIDQIAKIEAIGSGSSDINGGTSPTSWKVSSKSGTVTLYGGSGDAGFKLPGTNSIHQWKTAKVYDRSGNHYKVTYETTEGRPTKIDYTINSGLSADKEVVFIGQSVFANLRVCLINDNAG